MGSLDDLTFYLDHRLAPFAKDLPKSQASYQHLEFAGCGSISIGSSNLNNIMKQRYPGVFTKGFSKEQFDSEIAQISGSEKLILPCLRDDTLVQFNANDFVTLKEMTKKEGISESDFSKIEAFCKKTITSDNSFHFMQ